MTIQYVLYENKLTDDPNDYVARVRSRGTMDLDDVVEHMIRQEGSTAVRGDVLSTLEDFFSALESLLLLGFTIRTPSANYRFSITGVFDGEDDGFDSSRHQVVCRVLPGARLRRTIRDRIQVDKQLADLPGPRPLVYTDANSGARNSVLTPGGAGKLTGGRLKFDPADPTQGLFLLAADSSETRVAVVSESLPAKVHFLVPELAPGDYQLVVRTRSDGEDGELRSGTLKATLTVA
jgi:hypothetical protein